MSGWIKLHRQIVNWEWYSDSKTFRLFLHLLLTANHKDNNYRGKLIKKGCLVTGRELLSAQTGMSVREIRTCLERLKSTNEIAIKTNSKGTEIQVINYEKYQSTTNETTNERPANDQQTTTNKNDKNDKEEKENKNIPSIDDFVAYALERKSNINIENVKHKYEAWKLNGWKSQRGNKLSPILNWKSSLNNTIQYLGEQENNISLTSTKKNEYKSYFE
ncbi:hypothetical protein UFOVP206_52 [uncultured Caudovirales phage]|uniref:Uncharacterized protein n=1 Tax=uncultured Caudovirales phage TaxID=2100421 RepID=A0A6J7WJ18_9CAUD|nr:hypothetical protein UFOVP206_52 [uncultured Caudovirales phage]